RELGGLCVIGTERHESRRIDNQLRGRSGRQGDPGESQFYLSLEDDLMRRFGTDRIKVVLERMNLAEDDTVIKSKMLTRQVESAQRRVEGNNYDTRKQVLQYDDVMREQREIIYANRREVITAERDLGPELKGMIKRTIKRAVDAHSRSDKNTAAEAIVNFARSALLDEEAITVSELRGLKEAEIKELLYERALAVYEQQIAKLKDPEAIIEFQKVLILMVVDNQWTEHIDALDQLRNSVGLRGYAQNNPIVEYQSEGFRMFQDMIGSIEFDVTRTLMKAQIHEQERERASQHATTTAEQNISAQHVPMNNESPEYQGIKRNDKCPCGSGMKFKNCHGLRCIQ
ncbi:preprotein translocase subunit SecA, partial [Streptococcus agalactiae]|nr:preprotein translocase subunit SecA [Streptococcus agalactiae]